MAQVKLRSAVANATGLREVGPHRFESCQGHHLRPAKTRAREVGYVLAIARNQRIAASDTVRLRVDYVACGLSDDAWGAPDRLGSKGERFYNWAWVHDHAGDDGAGLR